MSRGAQTFKQSDVARATRGLLAGASAAGQTGNIEVDLLRRTVTLHVIGELGARANAKPANDINEWDSLK